MAGSFDALLNFRDVGESINRIAGKTLMKPKQFYRSARPDYATIQDVNRLEQDFGIRTILDLRTDTEQSHQASPSPSRARAELSQSFQCRKVNINGRSYSSALMRQLTYWQATQLMLNYVVGRRKEAISILGENVMAQRGLVGLAEDSLENCHAEIKAVFDILAEEDALPLLVHCTQGKDRTGLIVLLVLMLLQIPIDAIEEDYQKSQAELLPERKQRLSEIRSIGLPDSFADCAPNWAHTVSLWIEQKHVNINAYLENHCQISSEQQQRVAAKLAP